MAKRNSGNRTAGGILLLIGALIYLYVLFTWFSSGAALGAWVSAAQFLGPFVIGLALVSGFSLLFFSFQALGGQERQEDGSKALWRFIVIAGVAFAILGGASWFYVVVLALILTFIGAILGSM